MKYINEVVKWRDLEQWALHEIKGNILVQKYLYPYHNRNLLFRFTYFCDQVEGRKANYVQIMGPKDVEFLPKDWDYNSQNLVELYRNYNGLQEFVDQADRIVHLLNREFGYRLSHIKLDFIKTRKEDPKYWLIDIDSFKLLKDSYDNVFVRKPFIVDAEASTPVKCSLCGLMFKRFEMEKRLPMKMLIDLKNHTTKRKLFHLFPALLGVAEQFLMHNCRVCKICYMLIVQEQNLIEVEHQMALAQGIPVKSTRAMEEFKSTLIHRESIFHPANLSDRLIQWRVLIYPKVIWDVKPDWLQSNQPHAIQISSFSESDVTVFEFPSDVGNIKDACIGN